MNELTPLRAAARHLLGHLPYSVRWHAYALRWPFTVRNTAVVTASRQVFFIVGCQRSGTTMLGLALDSHPLLTVHPERSSRELFGQRFEEPGRIVGLKLPMRTLQFHLLRRMYPEAKYLFLTRDCRGVIASMLQLQVAGKPWLKTHAVRELEHNLPFVVDWRLRKRLIAAYVRWRASGDWVSIAVLMFWVKNHALNDYVREGLPVLHVSYDRLVATPSAGFAEILRFLDVEWHDAVLHHDKTHSGITTGGTDAARPIDGASASRWRDALDDATLEKIERTMNHLDGLLGTEDRREPTC